MDNKLWILYALIAIILVFLIYKILTYSIKKKKDVAKLNPKQTFLINKIQEIYTNNDIVSHDKLCKDLNIDKLEDIKNIFSIKNENEKKIFAKYQLAINNRYQLTNLKIFPTEPSVYNLILKNNEVLYHAIKGVSLYKQKVVSSNVSYSGVKWNSKYTRAGSLSYTKNDIVNFVEIDFGSIYITDKRIIFLGNDNKTDSIQIDNIISYELYVDGILLLQPNIKPYLLTFKETSPAYLKDGTNEFIIILSRLLNQTIDEHLPTNDEPISADYTEEEKKVFKMLEEVSNKVKDVHSKNAHMYNLLKNS